MAPQRKLLSAIEKANKARALAKKKGASERAVLDSKIANFHAQREALSLLNKEILQAKADLRNAVKEGDTKRANEIGSRLNACEYQLKVIGKQFSENITQIENSLRK